MKLHQSINFHITNTIAVCHQESLILYISLDTFNTTSSHSVVARINDCDFPRLHISLMNSHFIVTTTIVESHIRVMKEIVGEPFLNIFLFITGTNDKLGITIIGILFHNVPQDWHTTNLNHWLRLELRFLRYTRTETSCKKYYFHDKEKIFQLSNQLKLR